MAKHKKHVGGSTIYNRRCVLCNGLVPYDGAGDQYIVGSTGRVVCARCLAKGQAVKDIPIGHPEAYTISTVRQIVTPAHIRSEMDKSIIGQEKAKQALSVAIWKQMICAGSEAPFPKTNLLLYGPTGCGKTALVKKAAEIVDLPVLTFDTTSISETGYKGLDPQDIIKTYVKLHKDHHRVKHGIIFLDEFDKLAATAGNEYRASFSRGTQHGLLKLVEGLTVDCDGFEMPTDGLLFVFGGAFSGLRKAKAWKPKRVGFLREEDSSDQSQEPETTIFTAKDFIDYGMEPEIMGRIGQFIPLQKLTRDEMTRILLESDLSAYLRYKRSFLSRGIFLSVSDETAAQIAQEALDRDLGARGLNTLVEQLMTPHLCALSEGRLRGNVELKMEGPNER